MIMTVPSRAISLRGVSGLGIGETEQFLLQTLVSGAASFGGGFFGARVGAGAASGGQTPALQTLASAVGAPGPTGDPGVLAREQAALAAEKKKSVRNRNIAIGVGAVAVIGTAAWFLSRRAS